MGKVGNRYPFRGSYSQWSRIPERMLRSFQGLERQGDRSKQERQDLRTQRMKSSMTHVRLMTDILLRGTVRW